MSTLIITRGIPASGKTTWAKHWVAEAPKDRARVNRDDLRNMLYNHTSGVLSYAQEQAVTAAQQSAVKALLKAGKDVIADDMNVRPRYVREWRKFAVLNGAEFGIVEFEVPVEVAIERDAKREWPVGEGVIRTIVNKFTKKGELLPVPEEEEDKLVGKPYVPPEGKPHAIIVDIDGTLALMGGGRSPYDLDRVGEDLPNEAVIKAVKAAREYGQRIIFLSGREDSCGMATAQWLDRYIGLWGDEPLLMRAANDKRRDSIVKRELFDSHIRDNYVIDYVLDDRQQVVDMWRDLGLTVFQVAPGDF